MIFPTQESNVSLPPIRRLEFLIFNFQFSIRPHPFFGRHQKTHQIVDLID